MSAHGREPVALDPPAPPLAEPASGPVLLAGDRPAVAPAPALLDRHRGRRLTSGIAAALLCRAIGVLNLLVILPVTLRYLGSDLFGLWLAVLAITGIVASMDLGLGNGLMTKLAQCHATGDEDRARGYISTAYFLLTVVAGIACGLLWSLSGVIPWSSMFNVAGQAAGSDARIMSLVCLTAVVVSMPLSLIARVQYAYQLVGRSNLWQAAGSLLSLAMVLGAVSAGMSPFLVVAATFAGPQLANLINSLSMYRRRARGIAPRLASVDRSLARELLRLSGMFFVLTVVTTASDNADNLIIAHVAGLPQVAEYAIPARLFAQLGVVIALVNLPLWAFHGDALARRDMPWVRRMVRRMTLISVLGAVVPSALIVCFGGLVLGTLLGTPAGEDQWLLAGLGLWWVTHAAISPRLMVQNAAGVVRPQLLGYTCYLILSIPAKWYAAKHFGITIVPFVGTAGYILTVLPAALYGYRRAIIHRDHTESEAEPR